MASGMLDEGGRCLLTGLLPAECGCTHHRNSEVAIRLDGVTFDRFADAIFNGPCALSEDHKIAYGDRIAHVADGGGWACTQCIRDAKALRQAQS